jgi:hypothetical protein
MRQDAVHEMVIYPQGYLLIGLPNPAWSPLPEGVYESCTFIIKTYPVLGEIWWKLTNVAMSPRMTSTFPRMWLQHPGMQTEGTAMCLPILRPTAFCSQFLPPPPFVEPGGAVECQNLHCDQLGMKLCSRCHDVRYCSRACQKRHWKLHKTVCTSSD